MMLRLKIFFILVSLLIQKKISWEYFQMYKYNYSSDKWIKVSVNGGQFQVLFFNIHLIPVWQEGFQITNVDNVLINKFIEDPMHGELYDYDTTWCEFDRLFME